jgi:hypothetical protein
VRRWAPALANEDDACAPLDPDPSVAYRFGAVKWPDGWDPLASLFKNKSRPERNVIGPARSGSVENRPVRLEFGPFHFLFISRLF